MKISTIKLIQGILILVRPLLIIGCLIGVLKSLENFSIIFDKFYIADFYVKKIECVATQASATAPSRCYAYGIIVKDNGKKTGLETNIKLGYDYEINFDKKVYNVFYRKNGEFAIINREMKDKFDKTPYVIDLLVFIGIPFFLIFLNIYYSRILKNKIKNDF